MKNQFIIALNQVCSERNLPQEVVLETIEVALVSAYKRKFGSQPNIVARIDLESGQSRIYKEKLIVSEVEDERFQITLSEARTQDPEVELGETILIDSTPHDFGRIAAQTAKQVILQRIREAERDALFDSYADREGELIHGTVQSVSPQGVTLNLGRTEASLPPNQQIPRERYRVNQRLRAYVLEVRRSNRGPQIIVSRSHRNMLRRLLELEVPEIFNGIVEIKAIAREAGSRSKVAVAATQEGVDPVGSCVGMRGIRIQNIVNELGGEKVDVVGWNADMAVFIANALSPARVSQVLLDDISGSGKTATVIVPDDQLSLAIGKEGQNARLAAKLTNWRIDIKSVSEAADDLVRRKQERQRREAMASKDLLAMAEAILMGKDLTDLDELTGPVALEDLELSARVVNSLQDNDILSIQQLLTLLQSGEENLLALSGVGPKSVQEIVDSLKAAKLWPQPAETIVTPLPAEQEAPGLKVMAEQEPVDVAEAASEVQEEMELAVSETPQEALIEAETPVVEPEAQTVEAEKVIEIEEEPSVLETPEEDQESKETTERPFTITWVEGQEEEDEEEDEEEIKEQSRKKKKHKQQRLVYDEQLDRIVARRKRKPGRHRRDWEDPE
ncbi:MAG: transcription termination factor NusA [Chloroflexota bacterium]